MLRVEQFGGVCQAGLDVFLAEVRVVVEYLLVGPTGGQEVYDELDGEPGAFDDWLADKNIGVDGDAVLPAHSLKISICGDPPPTPQASAALVRSTPYDSATSRSPSRISARPRLRRDITVPIGMLRIWLASL